jgi:two-component system, sensor histidine kinase and response regulator
VALLESEGHLVTLANNGRQAVATAEEQPFDLVLMDLQMPEMDGLAAARWIRQTEAERGEHTPIVAMTAHAMKGDREICLEAGMDDYLSKPIQVQELLATIQRLTSVKDETVPSQESQQPPDSPGVAPQQALPALAAALKGPATQMQAIDMATFLARVEDDLDLLHEMIALFLESAPLLLGEVDAGIARQDCRGVECAAHALKGSMQSISAVPAAQAAGDVEEAARLGDVSTTRHALSILKLEFERLISALSETSVGAQS